MKVCGQCRSFGNGHCLSGRLIGAQIKVSATSLREGTESFCAESIEWKSRSQRSGGGAGTKLVLRSAAEEDELDRLIYW